jgi:2-deoxy-D-gluconate 3-dehydrogenase
MKSIQALFDLSGQVAVVTGAGAGIGKAIAMRLAEAGASVLITDVNVRNGAGVVDEIQRLRGKADFIEADSSQAASADAVIRFAAQRFGDLHILVNNAGIYSFRPSLEMTEDLWDRTIDINLKGVMFFSKAAAAYMIEKKHGGKIINIASIDAFRPTGNLSHYDASKGGVVSLSRALGLELAPHGILINSIAPGGISTPGTASMAAASGMAPAQLKKMSKAYVQRLPVRRMGDPDDVAVAALFLASAASDYMVGSILVVDGGALIS